MPPTGLLLKYLSRSFTCDNVCHSSKYTWHGRLLTQVSQLKSSWWLTRVKACADRHSWGSRGEFSSKPVYSAQLMALGQPRHPELQASTEAEHWGASQLLSVPRGMCWHVFPPLLDSLWLSFDILFKMSTVFMDTSMFSESADWQCACFIFYPSLLLQSFGNPQPALGIQSIKWSVRVKNISKTLWFDPLTGKKPNKQSRKQKLNRIRSSRSLKWNALNSSVCCSGDWRSSLSRQQC